MGNHRELSVEAKEKLQGETQPAKAIRDSSHSFDVEEEPAKLGSDSAPTNP